LALYGSVSIHIFFSRSVQLILKPFNLILFRLTQDSKQKQINKDQ